MREHVRYRRCAVVALVSSLVLVGVVTVDSSQGAADTRATVALKTDTRGAGAGSRIVDAPIPGAASPLAAPMATTRPMIEKSAPKKPAPKKPAPKKPAQKPAPEPGTPAELPTAIEPLTSYVPQTACEAGFRPGTKALGALLVKTYPGTTFGGDYACGTDGAISEHYEGRAVDWMNSARTPAQAAQATAVLHWLLDTDSHGNAYAIARRLGVMYIIWNNQIWSADSASWSPYLNCAQTPQPALDSYCHRNHIHISLSWDGAWARTSFFTGHVFSQTDYGPCRAQELNWAAPYTAPNWARCVSYPKLTPTAGTPPIMQNLLSWSGDVITRGSTGPAVMAVQAALKVPTNSVFDPATARAVAEFQGSRQLPVTAIVDASTWRALMAVNANPAPPATKAATKSVVKPAEKPSKKPAVAHVVPARPTFTPKVQPPVAARRPTTQPLVGTAKP